jgi:hypothetical protein
MPDPDKPRYRRIVRRHRSADPKRPSLRPAELWAMLKSYFGFERVAPLERIESPEALGSFIDTRSSFMAQTSLYGYLRTRAGMRYPELFDDDPFVEGINIAKWHVWLDCLSDLAVYSGSRLAQHSPRDVPRVAAMMAALVEDILEAKGEPAEAGAEYAAHAQRARERVTRIDWLAVGGDEAAFTESPAGLVRWAPVMDTLKELDDEIVRNSVRFRWQEVRRDLAQHLDARAVIDALRSAAPPDAG